MTHTLRIPSLEPYGYTEVQFEGSAEDAITEQARLTNLIKGGFGLDQKVWNKVMDEYLKTKTITDGANLYEQMSHEQRFVIQEIKKGFKRLTK